MTTFVPDGEVLGRPRFTFDIGGKAHRCIMLNHGPRVCLSGSSSSADFCSWHNDELSSQVKFVERFGAELAREVVALWYETNTTVVCNFSDEGVKWIDSLERHPTRNSRST